MSTVDNKSVSDKTDQNLGESSPEKQQAHEFNIKTWRADLALVVEEDTLYASKHVLALVSPVYEAMFNGEYKEKYTDKLPLPEKKYADVLEFLRCIYPNIMKPVTLENVFAVLPLADEYQVVMLKDSCESYLLGHLSKDMSAVQLYNILTKAKVFNLPRVTEKAMDIAADRPHTEIDNDDNTVTISENIKDDIRIRMLQNMDTKYKNISGQIGTSRALCKFLGASAKQKLLVSQYLEGHVVGDWGSLRISSPYNETSVNLNIDDILFTVYVGKGSSYHHKLGVRIQRRHEGQYDLNCFCSVVVNNWMKNKDDIIKKGNLQFDDSDTGKIFFKDIDLSKIEDETAGFICEGIINIDVFLFSIPETS